MSDREYVALSVFTDEFEAVSELLGLPLTKAWRKGERMSETGPGVWTHSRWKLESPAGPEAILEERIEALVVVLESRHPQVTQLVSRYCCELQCAIYYEQHTRGIHLDAGLLRRIGALGLDLDIDLYFIGGVD